MTEQDLTAFYLFSRKVSGLEDSLKALAEENKFLKAKNSELREKLEKYEPSQKQAS